MKQVSLFIIGLLSVLWVGCQPTQRLAIPSGWSTYQIDQDTAVASFALPPDFKSVNYFFYDSSEFFPGLKDFFAYDLGFKSDDFELSASLNPFPRSGLHFIKNGDWKKESPYKMRKIAGREFWIRERQTSTSSFSDPKDIFMYYLDFFGEGNNHLHIDLYCYRTKKDRKKARKLIREIAKTMDIELKEPKK